MTLRALYVDFNAYFASVEQHLRPSLRGRPIAVLPVLAETTCCIAASYEAKAFGVKTGTPVREAKKLCPEILFVEARPALYVEMHHRLVAAVESCTPVGRILSIDEMVCPLMGSERRREAAVALAQQIKATIAQNVGACLRASIGIAPNTFLAKIASDMQKPDGLTVIAPDDLPHALHRLALRDIPGIGRALEARLARLGITSVEALCQADAATLRAAWGSIEGERMHARLRGEELPEAPHERRSISHSHVLPPALRSEEGSRSVLHRLVQKAAMRLRSYGLLAARLQIVLKYGSELAWRTQRRCDATNDTLVFLQMLEALWRERPRMRKPPLAVGVQLDELSPAAQRSLRLFDEPCVGAHERLNQVIDAINLRYGKNTLYFAGAYRALTAAPMRIAFQHIPDLETEGD
ncbi:MAG: hypothetical protein N2441_04000 [Rhodocyclaceae bacterium]|nr:hypothetical protein [Rhodocyclaceae bacterium]